MPSLFSLLFYIKTKFERETAPPAWTNARTGVAVGPVGSDPDESEVLKRRLSLIDLDHENLRCLIDNETKDAKTTAITECAVNALNRKRDQMVAAKHRDLERRRDTMNKQLQIRQERIDARRMTAYSGYENHLSSDDSDIRSVLGSRTASIRNSGQFHSNNRASIYNQNKRDTVYGGGLGPLNLHDSYIGGRESTTFGGRESVTLAGRDSIVLEPGRPNVILGPPGGSRRLSIALARNEEGALVAEVVHLEEDEDMAIPEVHEIEEEHEFVAAAAAYETTHNHHTTETTHDVAPEIMAGAL